MTPFAQLCSVLVFPLLALTACAQSPGAGERPIEFTVVTYNVENLFDLDGVALFDDYRLDTPDDPFGYSRAKFLTKLENIAAVLKTMGEGEGPEIILFQELEADFTPGNSLEDVDAFRSLYADTTVAAMLTREWSEDFAGFPADLWLAKMLSDHGMVGYRIATTPSKGLDSGIAHTNAVFSKFPIREVRRHRLYQARDIIEAELDIDGHPFIVYVNHWKSGASNPQREPIRVENAKVLRALIDARLQADPATDLLVAGDLNAHYNHSILFPHIETGINDVLGSSGAEDFSQSELYNLWFELPPEARYSEVWRGRRGSLMHMLVTPGLYDGTGISYIDGSFNKLVLPGLNADAIGRPLKWHFTGETGGGASDHFPVYARFTTAPFERTSPPSSGNDAPDFEPPLNLQDYPGALSLPDGAFLNALSDAELAPYVAHFFTVEASVLSIRPLRLKVGDRVWPAYYANRSMIETGGLPDYLDSGKVRLVIQPNFYRGESQLVVEDIEGRAP